MKVCKKYKRGIHSEINRLNDKTAFIVTGSYKKIYFTSKVFYVSVKFLIRKFSCGYREAITRLICFLITLSINTTLNKKYADIALKNIIELDYELHEINLF